jgi:hypothetical protein
MPTKRTRVERFRRGDVDPVHWALLTDSTPPEDGEALAEFTFDAIAGELWARHGAAILRDWIALYPGTRPSQWWRHDAPRAADPDPECFYAHTMIEGRRLLKGQGRPAWEVLNLVPSWHLGIPRVWSGGDPEALVFESQREYLKRHGLLEKGEGDSNRAGLRAGAVAVGRNSSHTR